jgi:hypothetical protein
MEFQLTFPAGLVRQDSNLRWANWEAWFEFIFGAVTNLNCFNTMQLGYADTPRPDFNQYSKFNSVKCSRYKFYKLYIYIELTKVTVRRDLFQD